MGSSAEGEGRQEVGGPTLDQCLVLPEGLALEIDGLLSSDGGVGRERESGNGGDSGVAPQQGGSSGGSVGGAKDVERDRSSTGAGGRGGDRAIISSYHFEVRPWNNLFAFFLSG